MDATRYARYQVYSPIRGNEYDADMQFSLADAWNYCEVSGIATFAVLDALSLEFLGVLDMDGLTSNEWNDIYYALRGQ